MTSGTGKKFPADRSFVSPFWQHVRLAGRRAAYLPSVTEGSAFYSVKKSDMPTIPLYFPLNSIWREETVLAVDSAVEHFQFSTSLSDEDSRGHVQILDDIRV